MKFLVGRNFKSRFLFSRSINLVLGKFNVKLILIKYLMERKKNTLSK